MDFPHRTHTSTIKYVTCPLIRIETGAQTDRQTETEPPCPHLQSMDDRARRADARVLF